MSTLHAQSRCTQILLRVLAGLNTRRARQRPQNEAAIRDWPTKVRDSDCQRVQLLAEADAAMLQAQRSGKQRVNRPGSGAVKSKTPTAKLQAFIPWDGRGWGATRPSSHAPLRCRSSIRVQHGALAGA